MKNVAFGKMKCFVIVLLGILSATQVKSQSKSDIGIELGADVVSSYVWRGFKQAGASVQPSVTASIGNLSLGAWGSTDIASAGSKEVDFSAAYEKNAFKVAVTDYWWDGEGKYKYFGYPKDENANGHYLETSLTYTLPQSFPLSISWNTFVLGKGNKKEDGKNSYSTYVELAYPFTVKGLDCGISTGFTPWESAVYGTKGFNFTSVSLYVSKEIKITDSFSLPVFSNITANPHSEDIHFVVGFSL